MMPKKIEMTVTTEYTVVAAGAERTDRKTFVDLQLFFDPDGDGSAV